MGVVGAGVVDVVVVVGAGVVVGGVEAQGGTPGFITVQVWWTNTTEVERIVVVVASVFVRPKKRNGLPKNCWVAEELVSIDDSISFV